ncbi:MAG: hypothetical protein ACXIUW_11925 [Roseinatronobacter sp.]
MLQRDLLYTGVTRGKKLVVLVGQKWAVAIAALQLQKLAKAAGRLFVAQQQRIARSGVCFSRCHPGLVAMPFPIAQ